MRVLIFLLALQVLCLSAVSCCLDDDCKGTTQVGQEKSDREKDCNTCSPFRTCGSCVGFVLAPVAYEINEIPNASPRKIVGYTYLIKGTFYANIWQPPKQVI